MNKYLIILVLAWLLSACGAQAEPVDTEAVHTAIAQTLMAEWTATFTPRPANTITPTWTPTATATETPTPTLTDTPTMTASPSPTPDLRLIDADPYDFRITASDLPQAGNYSILRVSWMEGIPYNGVTALNPNLAWFVKGIDPPVVDEMVNGWQIIFTRSTSQPIYPQTFRDTILMFRSIEAAQRMALEFSPCTIPGTEYTQVETGMHFGDLTLYCTLLEMETTGYRGTYTIVFSYRNVYHAIEAFGWEREVSLEVLEEVARNLLTKLEIAPLSDSVTYQP